MSGFGPPIRKSSIRSWNWPWMSPQTVTGHFCRRNCQSFGQVLCIYRHLPLAARSILLVILLGPDDMGISSNLLHATLFSVNHTLSHSLETSTSASCLQFMRLSIQPSSVGIDPGSLVGDSLCGSGIFPTSTSIFDSISKSLCSKRWKCSALMPDLVRSDRVLAESQHLRFSICGDRLPLRRQ